ncbi:MAG: glycosyltransferase family 2 protein [Candidatus Latescibacteria bacterium]|nr:glycosyltransferase family 2 protein [Candidatus Latescibacterota bacterium]
MPLISVILPAYNAAATLPEAVETLLRQTLDDFEILLIDDGSQDDTGQIIQRLASADARVRPVLSPHVGLIDTLNLGLAHAGGQLIARMDADDLAHPDRLRLQAQLLHDRPDVALASCLIECFPADAVREGFRIYAAWLNGLIEPGDIAREIFIESPLCHPSVMVRRHDLDEVGGYQERGWAEDYDLWLRLHLAGKRFAKVPQVLLSWREHPARLTRTDGRYSIENFLRAKAHYLSAGPLARTRTAILWGAGQTGRRLAKHLAREGVALLACIDIDPAKIGRSLRGAPICSPDALPGLCRTHGQPIILSAVASRGARDLIRGHLTRLGLVEGIDFLCVA